MNGIDILKRDISLTDHISKRLGQTGRKDGERIFFKSGDEKTASLCVWLDNSLGYKDYSERCGAGTIIDFEMHFQNIDMKDSIRFLLDMYNIKDGKKELKKSPKQIDIFHNFEQYRFDKGNSLYQKFLGTRGISTDTMRLYKDNLQEIVKEFGFCEGLALGKGDFKDCMLFPCYNEKKELVGVKLRRVDGKEIGTIKSKTIKNTKTGIIYESDEIKGDVFICEGETDYIILKMLGFTSVIGNLGGAGTNAEKIQQVVKNADKIVCLYDNDESGRKGADNLQKKIGRPIRVVQWKKIDGKNKCDINDLFILGYREKDFEKFFSESILLGSEKNIGDDVIMEIDKDGYEINVGINKKNNTYYREEYVKNELKRTVITNFIIEIVDIFKEEDLQTGEQIEYFMLRFTGDGNIQRYGKFRGEEIGSIRRFRDKIKSLYGAFLCAKMNDIDLEAIIKVTKRPEKYTYSTNNIGYFPEKDCWIFDEGIIKDKIFYPYNESFIAETNEFRIESLQRKNGKANCLEYIPDNLYKKDIKKDIPGVFQYIFGGAQGDLTLGWMISSIFYTSLEKELTPFPILSLTGEKESGKTSGARVAIKTLGMKSNFIKNWESTSAFVELVSAHQTVSLFTPRDEMRNSEVSRKKESYMRNRFDRSNEEKGDWNSSTGKRTYKANSALMLSGEQSTEDPAAFSRLLVIYMRAKRDDSYTFEEINIMSDYFPSVIRELLEDFDFNDLKKEYIKQLELSNKECDSINGLSPRSRIVYSIPLAGYMFFNKILLGKELEITEEYISEIQKVVDNKKLEIESLDNIEDFMGTIIKIYETSRDSSFGPSLYFKDIIKTSERKSNLDDSDRESVIIDYNILYDKYVQYKRTINQNPEQKHKIKRKLCDEYGAKESTTSDINFDKKSTKRVLRIPTEYLSKISGFYDLVKDIEHAKKMKFNDNN